MYYTAGHYLRPNGRRRSLMLNAYVADRGTHAFPPKYTIVGKATPSAVLYVRRQLPPGRLPFIHSWRDPYEVVLLLQGHM